MKCNSFRNSSRIICVVVAFCLSLSAITARAADRAAVLSPFVNDDTFAAAYIDAGSLKVSEASTFTTKILPMFGDEAQHLMFGVMMIDGIVHRFQDAGGEELYVV